MAFGTIRVKWGDRCLGFEDDELHYERLLMLDLVYINIRKGVMLSTKTSERRRVTKWIYDFWAFAKRTIKIITHGDGKKNNNKIK